MQNLKKNRFSPEAKALVVALNQALNVSYPKQQDWNLGLEPKDSDHLLALAIQNGVETLLEDGIPSEQSIGWREKLNPLLNQRKIKNLCLLGEFLQLQRRFQKEGIPVVGFKGPLLAYQLFGDVSKRSFCDLDLLVQPEHLEIAVDLLQTWGYQTFQTKGIPENGDRYLADTSKGIFIDLHSALNPSYYPIPLNYEQLWKNLICIDLQGIPVLAFPPETLLILLCVHGTKDNWQQLKWICDIVQLLKKYPCLDWDCIFRFTGDFRSRQALNLGVNLCQAIFDISGFVPKTPNLKANFIQRNLIAHIVTRLLSQPNNPPSLLENVLFCWVRWHLYPFRRWIEDKVLPNEHDKLFLSKMSPIQKGPLNWFYIPLSFLVRPLRLVVKFLQNYFIENTD